MCLETLIIDSARLGSALLVFIPQEESFSNSSVNKGHLGILLKLRFWFSGSDVGLKMTNFPASFQMPSLLLSEDQCFEEQEGPEVPSNALATGFD